MSETCICITATITPNTTLVVQADPQQRLQEYKKTLEFYINNTDLYIFFLENSGYDLYGDKDFTKWIRANRLMMLEYSPHPDTTKGKGFQEFFLLDKCIIDLEDHFTRIIKITGRYVVENISDFVNLNEKPLYMDFHRKMAVGLTGFFIVDRQYYMDNFYGLYSRANDAENTFIEHVVYQRVIKELGGAGAELFPKNPIISGISGSYGASLKRNPYKMKLRGIERKIMLAMGSNEFLIEY